jgi:hypothetical protein
VESVSGLWVIDFKFKIRAFVAKKRNQLNCLMVKSPSKAPSHYKFKIRAFVAKETQST